MSISRVRGDEPARAAEPVTRITLVCRESNDLRQALVAGKSSFKDAPSLAEAVATAEPGSAVLLLADGYPNERTHVDPGLLQRAREKGLVLFLEYPDVYPGLTFGQPEGVHWERAIVSGEKPKLPLARLRLLAMHDCQFLPVEAESPLLVLGRVAGYDTAVFGLPETTHPVLFTTPQGDWIATSKLSDFQKARFAPSKDWLKVWRGVLDQMDPGGAPHQLKSKPRVAPRYGKLEDLPDDPAMAALSGCASWYKNSRLLITAEREPFLHDLLAKDVEVTPPPADGVGDGSHGILEGYASQIRPDGSQMQRTPIRADCQAETAAVLALDFAFNENKDSAGIARNLLDYLYKTSDLQGGKRGDPRHPAFGLIAWGTVSENWKKANYGDDNARTLLATITAAAAIDSSDWDKAVLMALYANLRTTGRLGFRGDRIDIPQLEARGWRSFHTAETVNLSPSFEAYLWACYLWAYARTGDEAFLKPTRHAIRTTMQAFPQGWRWGDHLDRSRMLLPLAWLVRIEDTPEHREWLKRVAQDLIHDQQPCGAIAEQLSQASTGHLLAPRSNAAYGTTETPLLQQNGDPVSDQLYTTNFALLGLREAAAATNDPLYLEAESRLADYLMRIQVRSESLPYLDGAWFRAFDFERWDYWASSGDAGWGAWCAETGWGPPWISIALALRAKDTSVWQLTEGSTIAEHLDEVKRSMAINDGGPYNPVAEH